MRSARARAPDPSRAACHAPRCVRMAERSVPTPVRHRRTPYDRAVLAALAVLAVVTLLAQRTVASPALARLRVVLPAWRFFDRAVESPRLWLRIAGGAW